MADLTPKQELFCKEYIKDLNATQAAIRAGYSEAAAHQQGYENLRKPCIDERIDELRAERLERLEVDADYVLKRLIQAAEADLNDIHTETGALKPVWQWPKEWRKGLINGIDIKQDFIYEDGAKLPDGFTIKVKTADRTRLLELLGKHTKIKCFTDKVDLGGDAVDSLAELMQEIAHDSTG